MRLRTFLCLWIYCHLSAFLLYILVTNRCRNINIISEMKDLAGKSFCPEPLSDFNDGSAAKDDKAGKKDDKAVKTA